MIPPLEVKVSTESVRFLFVTYYTINTDHFQIFLCKFIKILYFNGKGFHRPTEPAAEAAVQGGQHPEAIRQPQ